MYIYIIIKDPGSEEVRSTIHAYSLKFSNEPKEPKNLEESTN